MAVRAPLLEHDDGDSDLDSHIREVVSRTNQEPEGQPREDLLQHDTKLLDNIRSISDMDRIWHDGDWQDGGQSGGHVGRVVVRVA